MIVMSENTELKTFKEQLQSRLDLMDRIVENAVKIEDNGGVVVNAEAATDFRKALAESQELKTHISALEGYDEVKAWAAAPAGPSAATGAAFAGFTAQTQSKTLGEMFIDSDQFKDMISSGGFNSKEFVVEGNDLDQRNSVYTALAPTLTSIGFGAHPVRPVVPRQHRPMRVRDLFSVAQSSSNLIDFFRVTGFGTDRLDLTTSASTVPEYARALAFGLKPQSSLSFEADQAPVRTIAHWEAAHRNVLDDVPQLRPRSSTTNCSTGSRWRRTIRSSTAVGTGTNSRVSSGRPRPDVLPGCLGYRGDEVATPSAVRPRRPSSPTTRRPGTSSTRTTGRTSS